MYKEPGTELLKPLRNEFSRVISNSLPSPQSAILSGITLGAQESIPYGLKKQLQSTSTIHIVVASGQNLTILAGFLMSLVGLLGRKKTTALTMFVIVFYSLLTGFQVPIVRAAVMVILAYFAQLLGKDRTGWWVLSLTGGAMLLYNPNWLLNISFQLSFLATLGVVVVAPVLISKLRMIPSLLREDIAVTLSAQALVLPILAFNFGQISLIGIVVNSLILWTVPIVMIAGFVVLVLGFVNPFLGLLAGFLPAVLLMYFINLVEFFAKIPGGSIFVGETAPIIWVGYYLILAGIFLAMSKTKRSSSILKKLES